MVLRTEAGSGTEVDVKVSGAGEASETGVVMETEEVSEVVEDREEVRGVVREVVREGGHEAREDSHEGEGEMDREDGMKETDPLRETWSKRKRW